MILVVFSIGQFIGSDLGVLKQGFQEWFHNNGRSTSGEMVWEWMAKNLKPLRVNEITLEQFCEQFNEAFNAEADATKMPYDVFACQWPTELSHFCPLILSHFSREKSLI